MTLESAVPHQALLERVSERLAETSTATDQLLLTRWRVLGLCQHLISGGTGQAEDYSAQALERFVCEGPGRETDEALKHAGTAVARASHMLPSSILPQITSDKQKKVRARLEGYGVLGLAGIEKALAVLPSLHARLRQSQMGALLAGLRYRLELVGAVAADQGRPLVERQRASAAILYVDELCDAIPDTLGHMGLLDDDFALQAVLEETAQYTKDEWLHWSERISALWEDLPFLQGVRLHRDESPVATTWLDRINSYVSYTHALNGDGKPLILVQPSVACSPLHSILSLIGLLVLEGLTSSRNLLDSLIIGQIYEIDRRFYARYEGTLSGPPAPGWLKLKFRDSFIFRPPSLADRMVVSAEQRLSSGKSFAAQKDLIDAEPIQRFFGWDEAIGAASLTSRVLLVTSRQRVAHLLGGISSNGISLLDDGLVRFAGSDPRPDQVRSGLVLVVPTLTVARHLVDQGLVAYAIVVDGYERLHRGRHDLPFLLMRHSPPPVITWSVSGYHPEELPSWLHQHRWLQVEPDDLSYILELDGDDTDDAPARASLWEAATASGLQKVYAPWTHEEQELLASISEFLRAVRSSVSLPDYWKYHFFSSATTLRTLVSATPARWSDIQEFVETWKEAFQDCWAKLRYRAAEQLEPVARAHTAMLSGTERVSASENSKARAMLKFLESAQTESWSLVCDRPEQVKIAGRLVRHDALVGVEPVLLRDLEVCKSCIVIGWRSCSFGRRLSAHTPQHLIALVDEREAKKWDQLKAQRIGPSFSDSLLEAVGHIRKPACTLSEQIKREEDDDDLDWTENACVDEELQRCVPCMFIWLANERDGKVLARDARVLVEVGDQARETPAHRIAPEDRILLGFGLGKWSPAEEFTQSVVEAIKDSEPSLVRDAQEWRRALRQLQAIRGWTAEQIRGRLAEVGIDRKLQTVENWLRLDKAAPIGPRHLRRELEAMWSLLDGSTDRVAKEVAEACGRLRSVRFEAGRALLKLWKGRTVDIVIGGTQLEELVSRLQKEVHVQEVEAIHFGEVPESMLGWWITPELAERYISDADFKEPVADDGCDEDV